jgi:uncharacterized protein with ParB-like and HNH nuclease domain
MKIKPSDKDVQTLFTSGFYVIPRFQRPYSWEAENITDFWNDVCVSGDDDYFIGSMVVYPQAEGSNVRFVVDGQQRLTTLTILLCVLRNKLVYFKQRDLARGIQNLIERVDINNQLQYVVHAETSYPYFHDHIQKMGEADSEPQIGPEEKALELAVRMFGSHLAEHIGTLSDDEAINAIKKLRDRVLRLKVIMIELDNEDDAYLIFETLNTRGKDLEVADLLKNLLTKMIKAANSQNDTVKEKWKKLNRTASGLGNNVDLNTFIHHHWLSYKEYIAENKLFKSLKIHLKSKEKAKEYLATLTKEISYYKAIFAPHDFRFKREERSIKESLLAYQVFRIKQAVPTILSVLSLYYAKELSKSQVERFLTKIENFHFMFTAVTSQRSSGGISQMYSKSARELRAARDKNQRQSAIREISKKLSERSPAKDEFQVAWGGILYSDEFPRQKNLVRYILEAIDRKYSGSIKKDYSAYSIEHIEPQSSKRMSIELVASIGNLILVPEKLNNEALNNKSFIEKKKIMKEHSIVFDESLEKSTTWNEDAINRRLKALGEIAYDELWAVK